MHPAIAILASCLLASPAVTRPIVVDLYLGPQSDHLRFELTESELRYADLSGRRQPGKAIRLSESGRREFAQALSVLESSSLRSTYSAMWVLDGFTFEVSFPTPSARKQVTVINCHVAPLKPLVTLINRRVPGGYAIPITERPCNHVE